MTDATPPEKDHRSFWQNELIIQPEAIQVGHYIVRLDIPWLQTPFPLYGVRIIDLATKRWFTDHCEWVVVDLSRSGEVIEDLSSQARDRALLSLDAGDLSHPVNSLRGARLDSESVGSALRAYGLLDRQARRLIQQRVEQGPAEVKAAEKTVSELADYLQRNIASMIWLTRLKDQDDYSAKHSINCAILALGLAHALEWPQAEVERAGMAALLHDVGNVEVDPALLELSGPLTASEFGQVQEHTHAGYRLLCSEESIHPDVARAARDHHERLDGSGYPRGVTAGLIDPISRLVAVIDVFDALISERPYRPARSYHDALGVLWRGRGSEFDRSMVETFVQFMGWVAPGSLVRLTDQSLAVVEEVNIGRGMSPVIRRLEQGPGGYQVGDRIDLAQQQDDPDQWSLKIGEILPDGSQGLKVKSLLVAMLDDED